MATIVLGGSSVRVLDADVPSDAMEPLVCAVRTRSWAAIDAETELKIESRLNRKRSLKEQWHDWLLNYNRH